MNMQFAHTMTLWYVLAAPAWLLILFTVIARLNDIKRSQRSKRWIFRRIGLAGSIGVCVVMLARPFTISAFYTPDPTWFGSLIAWSWLLQLMTTPNQPPWHILMKEGPKLP